METTKKLNETPLISEMTTNQSYILVDDDGNVSRIRDVAKEYVTETELTDFIKPYDERITTNQTDISNLETNMTNANTDISNLKTDMTNVKTDVSDLETNIGSTKTDMLDLESYMDIVTPKSSAKGELVHITDALPLPTFGTKSAGNIEQETTKGYNILNLKDVSNTQRGILSNIKNNKISISGTATESGYLTYELKETISIVSGDNIIIHCDKPLTLCVLDSRYQSLGIKWHNESSKTISFTEEKEIVFIAIVVDGGTSYNYDDIKIMIERGTEVHEIEPFTNGASPNSEYPQEVEVLEGYNLWDFENQKFVVGARCIVEQTKDYIKLTATETGYASAVSNITLDAGDYIFDTFAGTNNYTSNFVTLKDDNPIGTSQLNGARVVSLTEKTNITLRLYISNANVGDSITITKIFVTKRNFKTQSTYTPYNHIGIEVCGKNKVKSIVNIPSASQFIATLFIDTNYIKPSTTYTIGFVAPKDCKMYFNENLFKYVAITGTGKFETYTITTLDNIDFNQYFVSRGWQILKTNSGNTIESAITDVVMVEGVVNDLTYEPYQEQIVPLDLKGNWVGAINDDIKDYLLTDKKKFWLVKNIRRISLKIADMTDSEDYPAIIVPTLYEDFPNQNIPLLYDITRYISNITNDTYAFGLNSMSQNTQLIFNKNYFGLTGTEWKTKYPDLTVELYYGLAKPQIIDLGELPEPIKTFEGVNNIQLLANLDTEIEVVYTQDVKKYYDNKLAEISAQII